jgi:hypothetical protein
MIKPLIFLIVIVGIYIGLSLSNILPENLNLFKKKEIDISETKLQVEEIKAIAKLFTQKYSNEILVRKTHINKGIFYDTKDKLTIIARGLCYAGTDLSTLQQSDIKVIDSLSIDVTIPKAKILESIINPSGFEIFIAEGYWETNDKAVRKVKLEAVKRLEKLAKNTSILKKADEKSVQMMKTFLQSAGFKNINIILR